MGSGCGRVSDQSVIREPSASGSNPINDELAVYLSLESPFNVNHKYSMFFPIISKNTSPSPICSNPHNNIETQRTGSGIRETFAYISKVSENDLIKKRVEYWGIAQKDVK